MRARVIKWAMQDLVPNDFWQPELRARYNNATLVAFSSDKRMTFDSMDDFLKDMDDEDLQAFLAKYRV